MATDKALERETKLAAPEQFVPPSLDRLAPGATISSAEPRQLQAVYVDTADLRLVRSGISLRHRTGEGGRPWTLKLPSEGAGEELHRFEVTFDGTEDEVPAPAVALVRAFTRGAALVPVARIVTEREATEVHDRHGRRVLEIADDTVTGTSLLGIGAGTTSFREIEIEVHLESGTARKARREAIDRLRSTGCATTPASKLARVLGVVDTPAEHQPPPLSRHPSLAELLRWSFGRSVAQLLDHDPRLRLSDAAEDLHQFRVAIRRLRSDLRTFRRVLDPDIVASVRGELESLSDVVGDVRDLDVLGERLLDGLRTLEPIDASAVGLLEGHLYTERLTARGRLREAMDSDRYVALLDRVIAVAADPPLAADHAGDDLDARSVVLRAVRRPWNQLRQEVRQLPPDPADAQLHHVRILAKRARYAAEAAEPVVGHKAERYADAIAELQTVLGDHQDTVVHEHWLRSAAARLPGAALVAGRLIERDHIEREALRSRWRDVWDDASRPALRRWMG